MQALDFEQTLEKILERDARYHREAYLFVRDALDYTHKMLGKGHKAALHQVTGPEHHVTGQELLGGIRAYALEQFGPMAMMVFNEWGVLTCADFGELVFNMVDAGVFGKTEKDSREDFRGGYDFFEAFRRPFLPAHTPSTPEAEAKPSQV